MAVEIEEPMLGLTASEGPIYQRFGYGIATTRRVIEIDRRRTGIAPELSPERVKLVDAEENLDELQAIYDRYRITQVGEVSRTEPLMREHNIQPKKPNYAAIHQDGYAVWSVEPAWKSGHPAHELWLKDLVAVTPEAHLALWNLLLSLDLIGPIRSYGAVAMDDLLPSILQDQRALRTTDMNDGLWIKVLDPVRCFAARTYRGDEQLVVGVTEQQRMGTETSAPLTETVEISPQGAALTDKDPDLIVSRAALGPLLLGNSASVLYDGGLISAKPDVLDRADILFGTGRRPHCRTGF